MYSRQSFMLSTGVSVMRLILQCKTRGKVKSIGGKVTDSLLVNTFDNAEHGRRLFEAEFELFGLVDDLTVQV